MAKSRRQCQITRSAVAFENPKENSTNSLLSMTFAISESPTSELLSQSGLKHQRGLGQRQFRSSPFFRAGSQGRGPAPGHRESQPYQAYDVQSDRRFGPDLRPVQWQGKS
jgi:hypothetical protein